MYFVFVYLRKDYLYIYTHIICVPIGVHDYTVILNFDCVMLLSLI